MSTAKPFRAFVSYCHADVAFAAKLQRKLEGYRIPKRLADRVAPIEGQAPGRIGPVFRDRDDLSAAQDLSEAVRAAMAVSSALIVVASPAAAKSQWVEREIELFRELHPDRPILVALAEGEPAEAMPPALLRTGAEPLAADFRPQGDGKRLAFLKIVAGLCGLPLDALVQRDAQRRMTRVTAVTLAAAFLALWMAAVTAFALVSRAQAVAERNQAEGLIEFMLTDLRERLRGVGRLDVMEQVNRRAMTYYAAQGDLKRLPDASLLRRARILHAMGEDDSSAGRHAEALAKFEEAHRVTGHLLSRAPKDSERIYGHAQSEYWLGSAAWETGQLASARDHFERYAELARQLVTIDPANKTWQLEAGYAASNLGTFALKGEKRPEQARTLFERSIAHFEAARHFAPNDAGVLRDLADAYAWHADSLRDSGQVEPALAERLKERAIYEQLAAADPKNAKLEYELAGSSMGIARLELTLGRHEAAIAHLRVARANLDELARKDPENQKVARLRASVWLRLADAVRARPPVLPADRALIDESLRRCATDADMREGEKLELCRHLRGQNES